MVRIQLTPHSLCVHVLGWDKLRAMRSSVTVPLAHITGVRVRPAEADFDRAIFESWRGVGTYLPGKLAAGSMTLRDGRSFYDVRHPEHTIAIDLTDEPFQHIVVELDGEAPESAVGRIESVLHPGAAA